jgi:hypothetical protein
MKHSGNVALIAKSIQFTTNEYSRAGDADTFDDKNVNLKENRDMPEGTKSTPTSLNERRSV